PFPERPRPTPVRNRSSAGCPSRRRCSDPACFLQTCSVTSHPPCSSGGLPDSPARLHISQINRSVFFRQQHRRDRPAGLADDVDRGLPVLAPVGGEQPGTAGEGALVLALILFGQLTPVAGRVAIECELDFLRREILQGPWSYREPTEWEPALADEDGEVAGWI